MLLLYPPLLFISKTHGMKASGMPYSVLVIQAKSKTNEKIGKKLSIRPKREKEWLLHSFLRYT